VLGQSTDCEILSPNQAVDALGGLSIEEGGCFLVFVVRHKRRTCARLCQASGGELEQIQFLLGHVSVQTTERALAASSRFDQPSMIALASSRILELGGGCGRLADNTSV
jgi:hypothetical protein